MKKEKKKKKQREKDSNNNKLEELPLPPLPDSEAKTEENANEERIEKTEKDNKTYNELIKKYELECQKTAQLEDKLSQVLKLLNSYQEKYGPLSDQ